jgi:DNA-directed RNA polymerase specialized sigma24 family protein
VPRSQKRKANATEDADLRDLADQLDSIRRLMILLLAKLGADSSEIGMALGVDSSTVRKQFTFGKVKVLSPKRAEKP